MPRLNAGTLLLVLIAIGVGYALGIASLRPSRRISVRVQCLSNLKQIGALAISHADDHGDRFPHDSGPLPRAFAAFQILVDASPDFDTRVLCSPAQMDIAAEADAGGRFHLGPNHVSYAYRGAPTRTTARSSTILAANDTYQHAPNSQEHHEGHSGGVNLVYVTGEATHITVDKLGDGRSFPEGLVDNHGQTR